MVIEGLHGLRKRGGRGAQEHENQRDGSFRSIHLDENFGGKKVDQWDCCGKSIVMLKDVQGNISYLNKSVGLYRARLNRKIVYIGRAI